MKSSYNVLSEDNGVVVTSKSSETRGCSASNVLCDNEKRLWLSLQGLPQELVFDLTRAKVRPEFCSSFGWYCWHSYKSNPSLVELWVSGDDYNWIKWSEFQGKATNGENLFRMKSLPKTFSYLKLIIKETFGSGNTYINQVLLYEDFTESISRSPEDQNKSFDEFKGVTFQSFDENPKTFISEKHENNFLVKNFSAYRLPQMLPKVDEVGKIRKEIKGWANDMENMQKAIETIASQVERISETVRFKGSKSLIQEIKDEIGKGSCSEPATLRGTMNDGLDQIFKREIELWQKRVMEPDFQMINQMFGGSGRNPQEILARIDEKLRRKAFLIRKKEMLHKLLGYKPKKN